MDVFEFNYKTTLPKEANAPSVTIRGYSNNEYDILFYVINQEGVQLVKTLKGKPNQTITSNIVQWCVDWYIEIRLEGKLISSDRFNPKGKTIFIKMDGHALGDNIAWIPYVEQFREKHNCTVICSTFKNNLFKNIYKNILFVEPNTNIDNVYAQYYIGASYDGNIKYSPVSADKTSLQFVATSILNLPPVELRPQLENQLIKTNYRKKYVCISEYASDQKKSWKYDGGWQIVVNYLNHLGYDVVVISKEKTNLNNVIDLTGNYSLLDRAQTLHNAEFFIGLSSGLSWLSWSVNTHVFLISDVTQMDHEFKTNITRISANPDLKEVNYDVVNVTKPKTVIDGIKNFLKIK